MSAFCDSDSFEAVGNFTVDDGFDRERVVREGKTLFVNVKDLEKTKLATEVAAADGGDAPANLAYDELNKTLRYNGKVVTNTYLVFKVQKDTERGENLGAAWSKKFSAAVQVLSDEFDKTAEKLKELLPRVTQLLTEATALLAEDPGFTPAEKELFKTKYRTMITTEKAKFNS